MTRKCMKVVCDRCGYTVYVYDYPNEISSESVPDDERWNLANYSKYNFDLCPKCARKFEKMIRDYWDWSVQE